MDEAKQEQPPLTPSQSARGVRAFMLQSIFQGGWTHAFGINGAIYTGYALSIGATRADIAFLVSLSTLASLIQLFSVKFASRIRNKKALVITCGILGITFRFAPIALFPLFGPGPQSVGALYVLVILALLVTFIRGPIMSDWMSMTIPETHRAKFTSQRWLGLTVMAIFAGLLYGYIVDLYPEGIERYQGFFIVFLIGLASGVGASLILTRAPMPQPEELEEESLASALSSVLKDQEFMRLIKFRIFVSFAMGISMPFYSIYMLKVLKLSYTEIAIYTNIALVAVVLSNHLIGGMVSRFGNRPVLQVLLIPGTLAPILWILSGNDMIFLVPVAMFLTGVMNIGMKIAGISLLWSMVPPTGNRTPHFAVWSMSIHLFSSAGSLLGGLLVIRLEGFESNLWGLPIGSLQVVFILAAALFIIPSILLQQVSENKAQSTGSLITTIRRGNPLAYLYNSALMNLSDSENLRVRAATGMARSGSPLAAEDLIQALNDLSPEVRRKAAEGLGMIGSEDAVAPLIDQMADKESDIRAEAAEALGRIGHPLSLDPLREALSDRDPRVRISAIRGLGELSGDGVQDFLYQHVKNHYDLQTFPTLVDVLSKLGDARMVRMALENLEDFSSPVIRAQLLYSACRALGAGEEFHRLFIQDQVTQAGRINAMLQRAHKDLDVIEIFLPELHQAASETLGEIYARFEEAAIKDAYKGMVALADRIVQATKSFASDFGTDNLTLARGAAGALLIFDNSIASEEIDPQELLFCCICLCLSITELRQSLIINAEKASDNEGGSSD